MEENRLGLALSSGGARGAYEAGAVHYLAERGIIFDVVSGTSIGALNGAYYAQGDGSASHTKSLIQLWYKIAQADILQLNPTAVQSVLSSIFLNKSGALLNVLTKLVNEKIAFLDPAPIAEIIEQHISLQRIQHSTIDMIVAVLPEISPLLDIVTGHLRKAEYVQLKNISGQENLKKILLAAAAIPLAFPSQKIGNTSYADAGLADELPAQILFEQGIRQIVSVFLSDVTIQNRSDFHDCTIFQIRPSININNGLFSTFDFSLQTIERLIEQGYHDAQKYYEEICEFSRSLERLKKQGQLNQELADKLPVRSSIRK